MERRYCRSEHRRLQQCIADIKRGHNRDIKKYENRQKEYREKWGEINRKNHQAQKEKGTFKTNTEYNKKYYQEHREEILARQKERRRKSEKG